MLYIIQGKTTVAEASRAYGLSPSEVENWVDEAKRVMENALLELRARKKLQCLLDEDDK